MTDKLRQAAEVALEALEDMNCGWKYIRESHGDLYGVGWDRAQGKTNDAVEALRQALDQLPDATKMIDTGTDRGAWSDVPDATKWVDELRGDDLEEPQNSTTDVVEREPFGWLFKQRDGDLYKLLQSQDAEWSEKHNPHWVKVSPLYTTPVNSTTNIEESENTQSQELSGKTEELEAEIKQLQELADYRLKLLTKMPSEWVSLTDAEVEHCINTRGGFVKDLARQIEAKLKEKNT